MKFTFIFLLLSLLFTFSPLRFAQKSDQHVTVKRGDYRELTFRHTGNVTSSDITFVVKLTKSFSSPRLIQKQNDDTTEISTTYSAPYTTIKVKLLKSDTQDLTSQKYFYDLVADSTTIFDGEFRNIFDVQTPFDGVDPPTSGTRFFVAGTFVDSTVADSSLFRYDETTHSIVPIAKEDVWSFLSVSDTVQTYIAGLQNELDSIVDANSYYSLTFNYPVGNEELFIEKTDFQITIDSIQASTKDSTITFNLSYSSTWTGLSLNIFNSHQAVSGNNTITNFAHAVIPKNSYLNFLFGSVAGSVSEVLTVKIYYR